MLQNSKCVFDYKHGFIGHFYIGTSHQYLIIVCLEDVKYYDKKIGIL